MRALGLFSLIAVVIILQACSTSKAVISHGIDFCQSIPMSFLVKNQQGTENLMTL